jgi:hypothetical protein
MPNFQRARIKGETHFSTRALVAHGTMDYNATLPPTHYSLVRALVVLLALPIFAWAQTDPASLLRGDAAPYMKLAAIADSAAQCGLRSGTWNDDAHSAIDDAIDTFTVNLFGALGTPNGQAVENDLSDEIANAAKNAQQLNAKQCAKLAGSGEIRKIDVLILEDPGLGREAAKYDGMPGYATPPTNNDTNP